MYLRATNVRLVTDAYLALVQSGYSVEITEVERGYIANKGYISTSKDLVELMNREVKAESVKIWLQEDEHTWLLNMLLPCV